MSDDPSPADVDAYWTGRLHAADPALEAALAASAAAGLPSIAVTASPGWTPP